MNYLWKVTVKKINSSEMVIGMWVEILKRGTTGRPTHIEIANALNEKYKTNISESSCGEFYFDMEQIS